MDLYDHPRRQGCCCCCCSCCCCCCCSCCCAAAVLAAAAAPLSRGREIFRNNIWPLRQNAAENQQSVLIFPPAAKPRVGVCEREREKEKRSKWRNLVWSLSYNAPCSSYLVCRYIFCTLFFFRKEKRKRKVRG